MIRVKKICVQCGIEKFIFSRKRCLECTKKSYRPIRYQKKKTGEKELFLEIWAERPHVCVNCKSNLGKTPKTWFFSHIHPKSIYPALRLVKQNIQLLCFTCHRAYDQGTKEQYSKLSKQGERPGTPGEGGALNGV